MTDFETKIKDAIAAKEIPGCVLAASDRDGKTLHIICCHISMLMVVLRLLQLRQSLWPNQHEPIQGQTPTTRHRNVDRILHQAHDVYLCHATCGARPAPS